MSVTEMTALKGFTREAVSELSRLRNEPTWMAEWRLRRVRCVRIDPDPGPLR